VSTAQDLPLPYGEPAAAPALRLVPVVPLDFDEAVRRVQPRLQRYATRRLGDLHEAEELVQEALLRAYSHRAQLLTEDDLAAWSTVVTGRLVIDRLRVRGRSTSMAEVPENSRLGRDTAEVVVARDEARLALDALDAMPARQAALLWAREVEGHSYVELCERFSMTEPAVRSVLTRARKALRKEYAARGGSLPVGGLAILAPWIGGFGWAERLRRVATRVSAPAALSAASISALSGLVLAPFGVAPGHQSYQPSEAVVTHSLVEIGASPTSAVAARSASPLHRVRGQGTQQGTPALQHVLGKVTHNCVNDTSSDSNDRSITFGGTTIGPASAGSGTCDRARRVNGSSVSVPLPSNPTGYTHFGITSDYVSCGAVSPLPVIQCTPTQQGAPQ
jgi:RNA polymerase sigma factor (sigma-70 family)